MSQPDWSSAQHRLDNLTNMRFVRLYAKLRYHIDHSFEEGITLSDLRTMMTVWERDVAKEMDFAHTPLAGRLDELGYDLVEGQERQDEAESYPI